MIAIDFTSPTWHGVKAWAEQEIVKLNILLAKPGTDPVTTELHRGRIDALQRLVKLEPPPPPDDS